MIAAAIAGVPMYADIFGTILIAEALLAKGALLGVVLSFMMAVTTLSLPSMIMLRKAVKSPNSSSSYCFGVKRQKSRQEPIIGIYSAPVDK